MAPTNNSSTLVKFRRCLTKCSQQLGPEDCDRVLEALGVAAIVATLWTCSGVAGVFSAPLATYCLIKKYRGR